MRLLQQYRLILHCISARHAHGASLSTIDMGSNLFSYQEAVKKLNTLQSNAATIAASLLNRSPDQLRNSRLKREHGLLRALGISIMDLDRLHAIHITGTKGKGTTSALCESILRHRGYKTGFFSSPHLCEVRERIRLNGQPISVEKFTHYFWLCYSEMEKVCTAPTDSHKATSLPEADSLPGYFLFLTLLAFKVFVSEGVDVAILEVGIGGRYDSTNVLRKPLVVGVTSLDIDHTDLLGPSLTSIAWHKGGIFKKDVPAYTVKQPDEGMASLLQCASEVQAPLNIIPQLSEFPGYQQWAAEFESTFPLDHQKGNAAMAVQLCHSWLEQYQTNPLPTSQAASQNSSVACTGSSVACTGNDGAIAHTNTEGPNLFNCEKNALVSGGVRSSRQLWSIEESDAKALISCRWPGRYEVFRYKGLSVYMDGAHTPLSISHCLKWFKQKSQRELVELERRSQRKISVKRALIINVTGKRGVEPLLGELAACGLFDCVAFTPNITQGRGNSIHQTAVQYEPSVQMVRAQHLMDTWRTLSKHARSSCTLSNIELAEQQTRLDGTGQKDCLQEAASTATDDSPSSLARNMCHDSGSKEDSNRDVLGLGSLGVREQTHIFSNITDAFSNVSAGRCPLVYLNDGDMSNDCRKSVYDESLEDDDYIQVLVTGSLHLVGGAFSALGISTG